MPQPIPRAQEKNHVRRTMEELRRRIFSGELAGGERLYEVALANELDVSRTPIRDALARLVEEGLLERRKNAGFVVRAFSVDDVADAIELRGVLEGTAARFAAERGLSADDLGAMRDLVGRLDGCFDPGGGDVDLGAYATFNLQFHDLLARVSGSRLIERELDRVKSLPFASPAAFLPIEDDLPGYARSLAFAQRQHHAIVDAIAARESARAEALAREHAREARRNLEILGEDTDPADPARLPGLALIADRESDAESP